MLLGKLVLMLHISKVVTPVVKNPISKHSKPRSAGGFQDELGELSHITLGVPYGDNRKIRLGIESRHAAYRSFLPFKYWSVDIERDHYRAALTALAIWLYQVSETVR
jgi:hypothetical protein